MKKSFLLSIFRYQRLSFISFRLFCITVANTKEDEKLQFLFCTASMKLYWQRKIIKSTEEWHGKKCNDVI